MSFLEVVWGKKGREKPRKGIPKRVKNAVWDKYIGMDKALGKCYACNQTIHITDFEVGHNKAVSKGGSDRITNLKPICRTCNRYMGTSSIEAYKRKYFSSRSQWKSKGKKKTSGKVRCGACEHLYRDFGVGPYMCKGHGILNSQRINKPRTWRKCDIFSPTTKAKSKYRRRGRGWEYLGK
ncbi:MAG: HNH endonuclease [Candidatus Bathyarchaeota archaeon]|nr:HNH endonuclease [Candidatus Bathyarchaeota archaeon]